MPSNSSPRQTVLVLYGGRSPEHPVSIVSAAGVLNAMDTTRYRPVPVGISPSGDWTLVVPEALDHAPDTWSVDTLIGARAAHAEPDGAPLADTQPEVPEPGDTGRRVTLRRNDTADRGAMLIDAIEGTELAHIDVVFPLLHGPHGEDGSVQGFFQTLDVPYVGAGVLTSAVGMDKHFMKLVFRAAGLTVGDWVTITDRAWTTDREAQLEAANALAYPLFVKPARGGSSLGVSKVDAPEDLTAAIETARSFDTKVIVEAGISGREIECAVLGSAGGAPTRASQPGEIVVVGQDDMQFYDFTAKYQQANAAELFCPAQMPEDHRAEIQRQAIVAFDALDGTGLSRVDFFYTPAGEFVINEINTMPGFTPISMYPQMWDRSGLSYHDLIVELIELAQDEG